MRTVHLALMAAACAVGLAACGRGDSEAAARAESGPPELRAEASGQEPAFAPDAAAYALARTGRPVVGVTLGCSHVVPQTPLTDAERALLGDAADGLEVLSLPELASMEPVRVTWKAAAEGSEPASDWAFAFTREGAKLFVTPWLEVLCESGGLAERSDPATAEDVLTNGLGGTDSDEEPAFGFGAARAESGRPSPGATEALRACLWARLGESDKAAEAAAVAGSEGFAALPTMLTYLGHKAGVEGLADGWSREWAWWTLKSVRDLEAPYAGREGLDEAVATLDMMKNEDLAPPDFPLDVEDPWSTNVPRYHIWRLRDSGGPPELLQGDEHGDPVSRLLAAGPGADAELVRALLDGRMTRQLVTDPNALVPDVLRFRDLALDLLNARLDLDLLEGRPVSRLSELSEEDRQAVVNEADAAVKRARAPE